MTNHIHLIAIPENAQSLSLTLGGTHAQYSLRLNKRRGWTGHVFQNRFFSCPVESSRLSAALHYVELNSVRAGLVTEAGDWPWSSARAHTTNCFADQLLHSEWLRWTEEARLGAWDHFQWKMSLNDLQMPEQADQIRRATRVGEPLGSEAFLAGLEGRAGKRLRVLARGRPPSRQAVALDGQLHLSVP